MFINVIGQSGFMNKLYSEKESLKQCNFVAWRFSINK